MSWLYLPEAVADCSDRNSLAGKRSATSKTTSIAAKSSKPGSGTACSRTPRSGTTWPPSTGAPGLERWISSLRASRASRSAPPATCAPSAMSEISGLKPFVSLTRCGRSGAYWRTCLASSRGRTVTLRKYCGTWPSAGLMRDGVVYLLQPLVRLITVIGSGSLPTPQAQMHTRPWIKEVKLLLAGTPYTFRRLATVVFAQECPEVTPGLHLSVPWLESIMGWPIGWTALEPLETGRFRRWLELHGCSSLRRHKSQSS